MQYNTIQPALKKKKWGRSNTIERCPRYFKWQTAQWCVKGNTAYIKEGEDINI